MAKNRDLEIQDWESQFQERLGRGLSVLPVLQGKVHHGKDVLSLWPVEPEFMTHLRENLSSESFVELKVNPEEPAATSSAADAKIEKTGSRYPDGFREAGIERHCVGFFHFLTFFSDWHADIA